MIHKIKAYPRNARLVELYYSIREIIYDHNHKLALYVEELIDLESGDMSMIVHLKEMPYK